MKKFISYCHNPRIITNRYTKDKVFTSCGKCSACINARHLKYVSMMQQEGNDFKYSFFCTLTFSDEFIPKLYVGDGKLYLYNPDNGFNIPFEKDFENNVDWHWFAKKKYFEYVDYSELQKFIKRIRQYYLRYVPDDEKEIVGFKLVKDKEGNFYDRPIYQTPRYYAVSEYGPYTVRPHFHVILYFNSRYFAENFGEYFYKSWSLFDRHTRQRVCLGERSRFRPCRFDADTYTAAYCDAVVGLPALYKTSSLRPRHSYSRKPSLGCAGWDKQKISQLSFGETSRLYDGVDKQGNSRFVSVPRSVENQVFPRLPEFNSLDDAGRMSAYAEFKRALFDTDGDFSYRRISESFRCRIDEIAEKIPQLSTYLYNQVSEQNPILRPFYQLYLAGKRFFENCFKFGLKASDYLHMIVNYWKSKDYFRLTDLYSFMEANPPLVPYVYSTYVNSSSYHRNCYPLSKCSNFLEMVATSNKIHADMVKTKKERDYQLRGNAVPYNPNFCLTL